MLLSKIKIGAAVLAATVAAGSSAGWVAHRVGAGEPQTSTTSIGSSWPSPGTPLVSANTIPTTADDERNKLAKKLEQAEKALVDSQDYLSRIENALAVQLIEARLRFAETQEKLKGIETDLGRTINEIATESSNQVADVQLKVRMKTEQLKQLRATAGTGEQPRIIAAIERELNQLQEKVRESEHRRQHLLEDARSRASGEARSARRELIVAEEMLRRLERQRDREVGRAEQRVRTQAAQVDRLQTLVNDQEAAPAPPANQKLSDLESKVDQILQELQEIRRSGKRQSSDPLERK